MSSDIGIFQKKIATDEKPHSKISVCYGTCATYCMYLCMCVYRYNIMEKIDDDVTDRRECGRQVGQPVCAYVQSFRLRWGKKNVRRSTRIRKSAGQSV